ncbi:protein jagged-1-like [Biomphalaria glabrata]|uniref:Delta-like protein n=1 Tax=Biomphalaria glabrata TaxID=6526 RepID=A0A9W2ZZG7_BIOGL|nr:protein jagged-1-like [Biomphalaria glabrata]XP_055880318.1 protein jagged-1-like [Biomphalaria glabrata]XP_055880319.1 protein jagged-1-like [Biomphalaria glabrata]XP_055880320.1 protein jagged-1-like [Biomphalaria glabrata]XP_055880321.1 protein jagged-1-like [Biomphalaria glabrata]
MCRLRGSFGPLKFHVHLVSLLLVLVTQRTAGSGVFQLQLESVRNVRGETALGTCCDEGEVTHDGCRDSCETYVRVCLKEFMDRVTTDGYCTFGNYTTEVLGGNEFRYPLDSPKTLIQLPFNFSWLRAYTLIVELWDKDKDGPDDLIERTVHTGLILPGQDWHTISHTGITASTTFRLRVRCTEHYYNTTCTKLCRPRDDNFGHFTCDTQGDKICLHGWMGRECDIAICRQGCHAIHGSCNKPGECNCAYGWQGPLCDQCIPYPGCKYGSCNGSPWQCICHLNWGGILCDKDLNYCGRHHPCKNNGLCRNTNPDTYDCSCPVGFSGKNCEVAEHACYSQPCKNGGSCVDVVSGFVCNCPAGWTGETCDLDIDECISSPCMNGGTCIDKDNGYRCECPEGWQGPHCQLDADECHGSPCVNALACRNLKGGYVCDCQPGWTGKRCDENIDDCRGVVCSNQAMCIDLVGGFYCACLPGFTGRFCQEELDECASHPCQNGAICHDKVASYQCECPNGYTGLYCQTDADPCNPNPCKHESTCFNIQGDFYCHCNEGWEGKDCSVAKHQCDSNSCEVIDSCTVSIPSNISVGGFRLISSGVCGKHGVCISQPNGAFSCACVPGYMGTYCHQNIDDCSSNPCQNSGTCIDGVNSYQCICADGWEGALCNINKNDCEMTPCRNGGECIDMTAEFQCKCLSNWKGKTCSIRESHCEAMTCLNGGTCVDLGDTFSCRCTERWKGTFCQIPTKRPCESSPCENRGTCVNSGDSYTCICRDGFEGPTCSININNCNPFPCYNGGTCIDGENWYVCDCARGFSGPDCRININECASNPCTYGSTCIDGIASYRCICPPGRTGALCEAVIGQLPSPKSCEHGRRIFSDGTTWEHDCNACRCDNGVVKCTKIWCGPKNCLSHPNVTAPVFQCGPQETCIVQTHMTCLTPPCLPFGECRALGAMKELHNPGLEWTCIPNQAHLGSNCAKIILIFDKSKMPLGISVESICNSLRQLVKEETLYVMCAIKPQEQDTVEITLSAKLDGNDLNAKNTVNQALDRMADLLSHKQANSSALAAVIEIRLETAISQDDGQEPSYLVPVLCSVIAVLGVACVGILIIWHRRVQRRRRHLRDEYLASTQTAANNENQDNIRRYRNPIFSSSDKRGIPKAVPTEELHDIDMEKYDKNPRRFLAQDESSSPDLNDIQEYRPQPKKNNKKDINIQLSRSLLDEPEVIV